MRVRTELIQQYAIVIMVSESMMASGMSRFGRLASSPVHEQYNIVYIGTALVGGERESHPLWLLCQNR
jgi:hypothetical protein